MPYSLHEKSGLVSVPVDPKNILQFEKSHAKPENLEISKFRFLDGEKIVKGTAKMLYPEMCFANMVNFL